MAGHARTIGVMSPRYKDNEAWTEGKKFTQVVSEFNLP